MEAATKGGLQEEAKEGTENQVAAAAMPAELVALAKAVVTRYPGNISRQTARVGSHIDTP